MPERPRRQGRSTFSLRRIFRSIPRRIGEAQRMQTEYRDGARFFLSLVFG
jgi:hypothetical protein